MTGHTDYVICLEFTRDGKMLASGKLNVYSGSDDRSVFIWDMDNLKSYRKFRGHGWRILTVAFTPPGDLLASGNSMSKNLGS